MFLLRFILLIIVFILIVRFISRIFLGFGRRTSNPFGQSYSSDQNRKEGEVYVDIKRDRKQKIVRRDEGEYIKYEELQDE